MPLDWPTMQRLFSLPNSEKFTVTPVKNVASLVVYNAQQCPRKCLVIDCSPPGEITLIALTQFPSDNIQVLKDANEKAFDSLQNSDNPFRSMLESPQHFKVMFDAQEATAILYKEYGIVMRNVWEVQMLDLLLRTGGLQQDSSQLLPDCTAVRQGSYDKIAEKLLRGDELPGYDFQDILSLPLMWGSLDMCIGMKYKERRYEWDRKLKEATEKRLTDVRVGVDMEKNQSQQVQEGLASLEDDNVR